MRYEFKAVPAPRKPEKAKGIRGTEARFANTISDVMNAEAADGWEYLRSEILPCESKGGMIRRGGVVDVVLLVFRREVSEKPMVLTQPASEATAPRGLGAATRD